jgi:Tfp pilus assembly protein PilF
LLPLPFLSFQRAAVWRSSLTLWSDAVAKEPRSAVAWSCLGEIHQGAGRNQEAIRCFRQSLDAFAAAGGGQPAEIRAALVNLATQLMRSGEPEAARPVVERLVTEFPTVAAAWLSLGNYYYLKGEVEPAESAYRRSLALQSDLPETLANLGNIELGRGRLAQAREYLLQAVRAGGETAGVAYGLACAEALSGRHREALAYLETALRLGFAPRQLILTNRELDSLRDLPEFRRLLQTYGVERRNN